MIFLSGCGAKNFENENDRLRREVLDLKSQIGTLSNRAAAAEKQLEIEKQAKAGQAPVLPQGVHRPVVSRIEIVKPSRGVDENKDGHDDAVRVYLETWDSRGRFLPALATVKVTVCAVAAGLPAVTVATGEFDAKAFDESYRSGIGGTHYTLRVPLTSPIPKGIGQVTVSIELTDLTTGASHKAEKIVNVNP